MGPVSLYLSKFFLDYLLPDYGISAQGMERVGKATILRYFLKDNRWHDESNLSTERDAGQGHPVYGSVVSGFCFPQVRALFVKIV